MADINMVRSLKKGDDILKKALRNELAKQGHKLSGALERSINSNAARIGDNVIIAGSMFNYGGILDAGTSPGRIPFSAGSGAGTSKFIEALTGFFIARGLGPKEAERAAFATARKQKKEGMSTRASVRFSKTGQRQNFIEAADLLQGAKVDQAVMDDLDAQVDKLFLKTKSETI